LIDLAAPRPLAARDVERRLGLEPGVAKAWLSGNGAAGITAVGDGVYTTVCALDALGEVVRESVERHQREAPHEGGVSLETLRSELSSRTSREALDLVIARADSAGVLVASSSGMVSTREFAEARRGDATAEAQKILDALQAAGANGLDEKGIAAQTALTIDATRSTLARLAAAPSARRLGGLWF